MPLHFSFSHSIRLVIAVAKGSILGDEVIGFLTKIDVEKARQYRKIFDVTELETVFTDQQIQRLAEIVREREAPAGPIAVVAREANALRQAQVFAAAVGESRLTKVFEEQHLARKWLDSLQSPAAASEARGASSSGLR